VERESNMKEKGPKYRTKCQKEAKIQIRRRQG
jgi:hypothetical protein